MFLLEPLGCPEFQYLMAQARLVLPTDSGGIQSETTVLGVPCLTLRDKTARPVTIEESTNRLVGGQPEAILSAAGRSFDGDSRERRIPELWDGQAAERIAHILISAAGVVAETAALGSTAALGREAVL